MANGRTREAEIVADLRRRIQADEWPDGALLPTTEELALHYEVGKGTISRAFGKLNLEGLVVSTRGRGRQVRTYKRLEWWPAQFEHKDHRRDHSEVAGDAWRSDVAQQGRDGLQNIIPKVIKADERIAKHLKVEPGARILKRERLRFLDGRPWQTADSHYPMWLTEGEGQILLEPGDITVPGGFMAYLGHEQELYDDYEIVRMPSEEECHRLEIEPTVPVLEHLRVGIDGDGTPVRVIITICPGDRHLIRYQLRAK